MKNYTSCTPLEQRKKEYDRYLKGMENHQLLITFPSLLSYLTTTN